MLLCNTVCFSAEPSSKLPCLFILWIHRKWLDRNCLLHVYTETESGFRFETEIGFDKKAWSICRNRNRILESGEAIPDHGFAVETEKKMADSRYGHEGAKRQSPFFRLCMLRVYDRNYTNRSIRSTSLPLIQRLRSVVLSGAMTSTRSRLREQSWR